MSINEHFELNFNAVWPSAIDFQEPVKTKKESNGKKNVFYFSLFTLHQISCLWYRTGALGIS